MNDLEHAQLAQKELEERAMREDELLRKCKTLTERKKLTDEEHRIEFERFTRSMRTILSGDENGKSDKPLRPEVWKTFSN